VVVRVLESEMHEVLGTGTERLFQTIEARLLEGEATGDIVTVHNDYLALERGDKLFVLHYTDFDGTPQCSVQDVDRRGALLLGSEACVIVIEGLGFVDGFEVPRLLKQYLNVDTGVYTLVRETTYDLFHRSPTFPAQVEAANLGIGYTNVQGGAVEHSVEHAVAHLNSSVPCAVIRQGDPIPQTVIGWLLGDGRLDDGRFYGGQHHLHHAHHDHGHAHHDEHGHAHERDQYCTTHRLRPDADPEQLMRVLESMSGLNRIKFNLGARQYNRVGVEPWGVPLPVRDDGDNSLTIYSDEPITVIHGSDHPLAAFLADAKVAEGEVSTNRTKATMRGTTLPPDDLDRLLAYMLGELPEEPVMVNDWYPLLFPEMIVYSGELPTIRAALRRIKSL